MRLRQTLPDLWLLSDERNDAVLDDALRKLPRGSGFIYRHYHLPPEERVTRWFELRRIARSRAHVVILADSALTAREWGADGLYGGPRALYPASNLLTVATAHSLHEIGLANRARAGAVLLSPVYPTRSHPGAKALGPLRFRLLASRARMPVIALGGMMPRAASRLAWPRWAAVDGLSQKERHAPAAARCAGWPLSGKRGRIGVLSKSSLVYGGGVRRAGRGSLSSCIFRSGPRTKSDS